VPDDAALAAEVADLESGRSLRRRRARRRSMVMMVMVSITIGIRFMGAVEMIASHQVIQTLETQMAQITAGRPDAALPDLRGVSRDFGWTLAGRRATALQEQMFELQVRMFERQLSAGTPVDAVVGLVEFRDHTIDGEKLLRLDALVRRARAEIPAAALFEQVNRLRPDPDAVKKFARLTSPELVEFHVDRLLRSAGVFASARQLILEVLREMNEPRAMAAVARVFVHSEDTTVRVTAGEMLRLAAAHRADGQEAAWAEVYPELTEARKVPLTAMRAGQALAWLRGDE
jgi:hypothetical protein